MILSKLKKNFFDSKGTEYVEIHIEKKNGCGIHLVITVAAYMKLSDKKKKLLKKG